MFVLHDINFIVEQESKIFPVIEKYNDEYFFRYKIQKKGFFSKKISFVKLDYLTLPGHIGCGEEFRTAYQFCEFIKTKYN